MPFFSLSIHTQDVAFPHLLLTTLTLISIALLKLDLVVFDDNLL